jgi:hypothetical protein
MEKAPNSSLLVSLLVLLLSLSACNTTDVNGYMSSVEGSERLNKAASQGDYQFQCRYVPAHYLALMELKKQKGAPITRESLEAEARKFSNTLYFYYIIGLKDKGDVLHKGIASQAQYTERLSELTFNLMRDVSLISEGDTIKPLTYNYINTYGMEPDLKFLFAFPDKLSKSGDVQFIYRDKIFGIYKDITFSFDIRDFKNLPEIQNFN